MVELDNIRLVFQRNAPYMDADLPLLHGVVAGFEGHVMSFHVSTPCPGRLFRFDGRAMSFTESPSRLGSPSAPGAARSRNRRQAPDVAVTVIELGGNGANDVRIDGN